MGEAPTVDLGSGFCHISREDFMHEMAEVGAPPFLTYYSWVLSVLYHVRSHGGRSRHDN